MVVQRFGVGLVIERSVDRLPAGALSNQLGQLSLSSLRGKQIEYQPDRLGLRRTAFVCVGWQVKLSDPIWQVTSRSCEMVYYEQL